MRREDKDGECQDAARFGRVARLESDLVVPVSQARAVHLGDRGACEGPRVDKAEGGVEGRAEVGELGVDDAADLGERHRRGTVEALLKLENKLLGEERRRRRDKLADLDVGRPAS